MNDHQLLRYSRHILLDEIGTEGQQKLLDACVLVLGCGGLGSAALPYLAAAGVGRLIIADHDCVDETNLQRQTAYKSPSAYSRSVDSFNQAKQQNDKARSGRSGFFGGSKSGKSGGFFGG